MASVVERLIPDDLVLEVIEGNQAGSKAQFGNSLRQIGAASAAMRRRRLDCR
jgi:hypothetical protein